MKLYDRAPTGATSRARNLRRNATEAEKALLRALRQQLSDHKWRAQAPIAPYIVDILCFAEGLIIELDGGQHGEATDYDARRTRFVEAQGFRVIRFWNNEVLGNLAGVVETIATSLESLSPREREGGAKRRKGEALLPSSGETAERRTSPSQPAAGPLPLPWGEGKGKEGKGRVREPRAPYASSSNVTATSALALRRTVSPSTAAISPFEI